MGLVGIGWRSGGGRRKQDNIWRAWEWRLGTREESGAEAKETVCVEAGAEAGAEAKAGIGWMLRKKAGLRSRGRD